MDKPPLTDNIVSLDNVLTRLEALLELEREVLKEGRLKELAAITREKLVLNTSLSAVLSTVDPSANQPMRDRLAQLVSVVKRNQRLIKAAQEGRLRRLKVVADNTRPATSTPYGQKGYQPTEAQRRGMLSHSYHLHVVNQVL